MVTMWLYLVIGDYAWGGEREREGGREALMDQNGMQSYTCIFAIYVHSFPSRYRTQ